MKIEKDLTVGHVPIQLIKFAIPLFFANLLQSLYSIVDMLVVGRIVGVQGLLQLVMLLHLFLSLMLFV